MIGAGLVGWAIDAVIASALLMLAILLLRARVRRVAGARIAYALWALPVLRLVLPPLPHWPAAIATPVSQAGETIVVLIAPAAAPAMAAHPFPIAVVLIGLWAAGALLFLGWHVANHRHFCRHIVDGGALVDVIDGVRIIESATAPGPIAFGIVDRYVAFPIDIADRYDADERALALAHELGHHARGDLIANWIALVVLAVHWFDPVAWRAFRAFRADQELANDARVLAGRSAADRHIYACAIVKAAHGGAVSAACHLHTVTDLKGRLKMLTTTPASHRRLVLGVTTVGALVIAGLGLTASGSSAAAISAGVQDAIAPAAPPVPPTLPMPPMPPMPPARTADGSYRSDHVEKVDGKIVREAHFSASKNGVAHGFTLRDGDKMQFVPVTAGDCGKDDGSRMFVIRKDGNPPTTVICTDRITQAAMAGTMTEADGKAIEHKALTAALEGLRATRAGMMGNAAMPPAARTDALKEIDAAINEVEDDLAHPGKEGES